MAWRLTGVDRSEDTLTKVLHCDDEVPGAGTFETGASSGESSLTVVECAQSGQSGVATPGTSPGSA